MFPLFLLPFPLFFHVAGALLNVTIDDTDPMIAYSGSWDPSATHIHTLSVDPTASATLTFTGVAVYYLVPRWPYAVNVQLSLDGGSGVIVNLTDPDASTTSPGGSESAKWSAVWGATGLTNTTHKLVLTMAPTGDVVVADGFIYTVNNGSTPSSSSSKRYSQTGGAPSPTSSTISSAPSNTLAIGIGTALGLAAVIAAGVAAYFLFFKRRKQDKNQSHVLDEWGQDAYPYLPPTPFVAGMGGASPRRSTTMQDAPDMSDVSAGRPLLSSPWDGDADAGSDRPMTQYSDAAPTHSFYGGGDSDHTRTQSYYSSGAGRNMSVPAAPPAATYYPSASGSSSRLPPGAAATAYEDDPSELASGSGAIARSTSSLRPVPVASAGRREKAVPPREQTYSPAPPAYTES
ncbi:hypothetical protein R3P38DRAFT_3304330 [Favolaschia claudopus]|uniref:Uncharacterized protein n=1 Tax=Favolaschia claudopus TaxID=2862362 RepID=A0AAW0E1S4_9AGAR